MKRPWKSASPAERDVESPSSLNRSKAESRPIRGRISNPIPIPGPMDDEFPMRNPGNSIAQVTDPDDEANTVQREITQEPVATPSKMSERDTQVVRAVSREPESAGSTQGTTGLGSIPTHDPSTNGTANPGGTNIRYSTFSASTTRETNDRGKPQRKKSTLRGVFSKLFGRRKKDTGQAASVSENGSTPEGSRQHRSDPTNWPPPVEEGGEEPKRSNSMPLADYGKALRSHAVASKDRLVIESARNSAVLEHGIFKSKRPGSGLELPTPGKYRGLNDEEMSGLSPRPASMSGRLSRSLEPEQDSEEAAVPPRTSGSSVLHRRSQSLSALQKSHRLEFRRMSSELRYWRESFDAENDTKSPLESSHPAETDETRMLAEDGNQYIDEPTTPIRPFAFDDLDMAGMKITEAVSMTNRLSSLEARSKKLEKVVTKLCHAVPPREPTRLTATGGKPNAPQVSYQNPGRGPRHSSASSKSSLESEVPEYLLSTSVQPAFTSSGRPTSTATIRGVASLPALSKELQRPLTYDHYSNLMALLETERSARMALETQVKELRHQVQLLSKSRRGTQGGHSFSEQSAFDYDDDDEDEEYEEPRRRRRRGKAGLVPDDSGLGGSVRGGPVGEDDYSDAYATPHEGQDDWGAAVEGSDEEGAARRKAARTMSLSQMTMGKQQRPRVS